MLNILLFILLIIFTAMFVAFEFAIVKVRQSRIDNLEIQGNKNAKYAKIIIEQLDEYLSATQLGITVTALGLGWIGEPTVAKLIEPIIKSFHLSASVATALSFGISFFLVTTIHVVVGELAPKTIAIQKAEQVTLFFARPMMVFYKVLYPFIRLLNGSAGLLVRLFGFKPATEQEQAHSEEEIRLLLSQSFESGEINHRELNYVNNIFEFDERLSREIMVPRTKVKVFSLDDTKEEIETLMLEGTHTRYPVTENGDKDNIVGVINIKEFLIESYRIKDLPSLKDHIKPVLSVIETMPIHDLLLHMQRTRTHIAILLDEYGGTSGIVTIEDIIEEIVGEIRDEFDHDEVSDIQVIGNSHYLVNGVVLIEDINELLNINIDDEEIDTIGGWLLTQQFDLKENQTISYNGYTFVVKKLDGHQVDLIEIKKK